VKKPKTNINTPRYWNQKYLQLAKPNKVLYTKHKQLYERIADFVFTLKHDVVVDFGAGIGPLPFLLDIRKYKFEGRRYIAVDQSKEGLKTAKEYVNAIEPVVCDVTDKSVFKHVEPGSVDLVVCVEVLEHLTNPITALSNIKDLLNENGRAIVSIPYGKSPYKDHYHIHIPKEKMEEWHEAVDLFVESIIVVKNWIIFKSRRLGEGDAKRIRSKETKTRTADLRIPIKD